MALSALGAAARSGQPPSVLENVTAHQTMKRINVKLLCPGLYGALNMIQVLIHFLFSYFQLPGQLPGRSFTLF